MLPGGIRITLSFYILRFLRLQYRKVNVRFKFAFAALLRVFYYQFSCHACVTSASVTSAWSGVHFLRIRRFSFSIRLLPRQRVADVSYSDLFFRGFT